MSARVTSSIEVLDASISSSRTETGRLFVIGVAGEGPPGDPTVIRGMAEYREVFGLRSGGTDLYDCLQQAFAHGLAEAVVLRLAGPAAKPATIALGTLTVTATTPGAAANGWTAAYTVAAGAKPVFTLTGPGVSERYVAEDGPGVIAAVNAGSTKVALTGTAPTATTSKLLAAGADDAAHADFAAGLDLLSADLGVGAVAAPGKVFSDTNGGSTVGALLAAHAAKMSRLALLSMPASSTVASAKSAAVAIAAYPSGADRCVLLYPRMVLINGTTVEWVGVAAGLRAAAHSRFGPHRSLISIVSGTTSMGVPESAVGDADWADLDDSGVSVLRTVGGRTRVYGWKLVRALGGNANLDGAQHADTLNAIRHEAVVIAENFVGTTIDGRGHELERLGAELRGMLMLFAERGGLFARIVDGTEVDPGWVVDVGPGVNSLKDVAAGHVKAQIGVRLSPIAEFVHITITAVDATAETL